MGGIDAPAVLRPKSQTLGPMEELAFCNVPQWGQRWVARATTSSIYSTVSNKLYIKLTIV